MNCKVLFLLNALLLLASCASMGQITECRATRITSTIDRARESFDRGAYGTALDLYSSKYKKCQNRDLASEYKAGGEKIRNAADHAYDRKDFIAAGAIYYDLLLSAITAEIPRMLTFDRIYLKNRISACSQALTESGLMKYREENLDEAIEIWEKALAFDPENQTITKAVETAIKQRRQLRNIK